MKVLGYELDDSQEQVVKNSCQNLLVIAGAGSGKTLTIIAKIKYLVTMKKIRQEDIIAISFTNNAKNSLEEKLSGEALNRVGVFTFHKLAMLILDNANYELSDQELLNDIIHEFFYIKVLDFEEYMYIILKYFNEKVFFDIKETYQKFIDNNKEKIELFEKLIATFIHQLKSYNKKLEDFKTFLKKIKSPFNLNYFKEKTFLIIALNIYIYYEAYLHDNHELDFDDLILEATKKVNNSKKIDNIKYIIIDEYQDISYIRLMLIKEIIKKTNAKLMVVGDDYQSIYGFSGSDVLLFWKFREIFTNSAILYIDKTYRNSQELVDCANCFITKNKKQLPKKLVSNKHLFLPIKVIYYRNIRDGLKEIFDTYFINERILILGRNNNDIYKILDKDLVLKDGKLIYLNNLDLDISYMTVHKSKGLEEDNVIIIDLENTLMGFPCQIKTSKIFRVIREEKDNFLYAEERRLFYVALTRTRNYTFLLSPINNKSIFVKEMEKIIKKNSDF